MVGISVEYLVAGKAAIEVEKKVDRKDGELVEQ